MRILPFVILAVVALALQVAVGPAMAVSAARFQPQFLLLLAMFIALYAKADAALIGCWTLGLLTDLCSIGPMGGFAFAFGLGGLGIVRCRALLFRDHPLSHLFLALAFGLMANGLVAARLAFTVGWSRYLLLVQPFGTAGYTALLAPCLMPLLNGLRRTLRFPER